MIADRNQQPTLWQQAQEAEKLRRADLHRIVAECQRRIESGHALTEDYVQFIACKLELTQRAVLD